jgi:hypothetical protein
MDAVTAMRPEGFPTLAAITSPAGLRSVRENDFSFDVRRWTFDVQRSSFDYCFRLCRAFGHGNPMRLK